MSLRVMCGTATAAASECVRAWMRSSLISGSVRTSAEAGRSADFSRSAFKRMRQQRASRSCSRENFVCFPGRSRTCWDVEEKPKSCDWTFKVQGSSFIINQSIFNHSFKIALLSILEYIYRALKFHYQAAYGARITCRYKKKNPKMYKTTSK